MFSRTENATFCHGLWIELSGFSPFFVFHLSLHDPIFSNALTLSWHFDISFSNLAWNGFVDFRLPIKPCCSTIRGYVLGIRIKEVTHIAGFQWLAMSTYSTSVWNSYSKQIRYVIDQKTVRTERQNVSRLEWHIVTVWHTTLTYHL